MKVTPNLGEIAKGGKQSSEKSRAGEGNRKPSPTVSIDPADLEQRFDLLQELEENREAYLADEDCEWLSMPNFPGYLLTAVDTCRAHCLSVKPPSQACTLTCCIAGGINLFYTDEDIKSLIALKKNLYESASTVTDSESLEMAAEFFREFPLGIPGTISKVKRVNVPMPTPIKRQVAERASELGTDIGSMGVLCVMVTISSQPLVHPKHAEFAADTIQSFLRGVGLRRRLAKVFLEEIQ